MTPHLPTLNSICQSLDHRSKLSRSPGSRSVSLIVSTVPKILVSSANFINWLTIPQSMSLMKMRKSIGPSTEPCGTPLVTSDHDERQPFKHTRCFRPLSHACIQLTLWLLSFISSLWWGTLSKAFAKSRNITATLWPSSTDFVTDSKKARRLVRQDLFLTNPCWLLLISLFLTKCSTTASRIMLSKILQTWLVKLTFNAKTGKTVFVT